MNQTQTLYIGAYTNADWLPGEKGRGVYRAAFDWQTGRLALLDVTEGLVNPSFGCFNAAGNRLYVVNEIASGDQDAGRVSTLAVEADGALALCGVASSFGQGPCYIALDPQGRAGFLTNYVSGSAVSLQMDRCGVLTGLLQRMQHSGSSVNPARQAGPHAHSLCFDPQGRFLFVADLGLDQVVVYRVEQRAEGPWLERHGSVSVAPGMGPRHMAFDAQGRRFYLLCEMGSQIYVFDYDAAAGALRERQRISALPEGFAGENISADLHFGAGGRYLYASNRGHDSIVAYAVCPETGCLTLAGFASAGGRTPRNFTLTDDGRWLLVANQDTGNVVSFAVDAHTGLLEERSRLAIPAPVWLGLRP